MKLPLFLIIGLLAAASPAAAAGGNSTAATEPLSLGVLKAVAARFHQLMDLANRHDIQAIHGMFWQSPSALLVAKSATPAEGNWSGFWGNAAIDQKLHDIAASGPVILMPDYAKLKVVGLTHDIAESYAPMAITVSYAGQDCRPKPFLMIVTWKKIGVEWEVASEIILPIPPAPPAKG